MTDAAQTTAAPRRTALYDVHLGLGAMLTDFAGWEMPLRYDSEAAEHRAVRSAAGLFDLSHMGQIDVLGPQAGEALDYAWYEEPLYDYDLAALKKLSAALEIPVVGTETIVGGTRLTAQFLAQDAVDIVRTDVSWRGGVSSVMATAHLAEAFGVSCELHTTIYHPLELVNLQCSLAVTNCEYFEVLYPMEQFAFGLAAPMDIRADGYIYPSSLPGLGIDYDWSAIDAATTQRIVVD